MNFNLTQTKLSKILNRPVYISIAPRNAIGNSTKGNGCTKIQNKTMTPWYTNYVSCMSNKSQPRAGCIPPTKLSEAYQRALPPGMYIMKKGWSEIRRVGTAGQRRILDLTRSDRYLWILWREGLCCELRRADVSLSSRSSYVQRSRLAGNWIAWKHEHSGQRHNVSDVLNIAKY